MELLKFITAGSVDDGKSTLIGRLLYEVGGIYEDQLEAARKASKGEVLDFSLITDGLSAEREQKITIDVAYRYFSTPKRKFIIADVPGHEEYTRNMVTAASNADAAVLLIDAKNGFTAQSKRHLFLSSMVGISHILVAVNKIDEVGFSENVFNGIKNKVEEFCEKLNIKDLQFIPTSALLGDNITRRSKNMDWYEGPLLLSYLENLSVAGNRNLVDFRFPVQMVLRPNAGFRGYAGQVASGTISPGEEVMILPRKQTSRIKSIITGDKEQKYAFSPQAAVITLENDLDVSRGDMIVRANNLPHVQDSFEAVFFWMSPYSAAAGDTYLLKHATSETRCWIKDILYVLDIDTLHRKPLKSFNINDVGRVRIKTAKPLVFDAYGKNKHTGSFILIDEFTNNTVGAGIIIDALKTAPEYGQA